VSSGFCGDSIRVHVGISRVTESGGVKFCPIQQSNQPIVLTFARFINLDGAFDQTVSGPDVFPGQTIDKSEVLAWVRDKEHPMNPLFPGILRGAAMETASQSAIFEFNSECKAWHYGWTAPRGQGLSGSDAQHVLEILFMKPMGAYMYCLERLRSDGFSIYSSRRASHAAIKPEAEPFENGEHDDRSVKRKRTQVPPSPAGTISSIASDSPLASPEKEDSWNRAASTTTSEALIKDVTTSLEHQTFKSEPTIAQAPPSSSFTNVNCPLPSDFDTPSNFSMLLNNANGMQAQQQSQLHQQLQSQMNSLPEGGMHNYLPPHYPSGDLMSHTLFNDMQPPRRVVASEELPWSELYNLFDSVAPLAMVTSDEDPDRDYDSPGSTPTPSSGGYGDDDDIALQTNAFTQAPLPSSSQAVLNYL
jgi:hypothetical protein